MKSDELKNKIAKFICNACEMGLGAGFNGDECAVGNDYRKCKICGETAEAIINADIYNVKETFDRLQNIICETSKAEAKAEHRAEVAERALKECSKRLSVFTKTFGDGATEDQIYEILINKAEKELLEEKE